MKSLLSITLIIALFTVIACTKGEQGPPGKDGNANVHSQTITLQADSWEHFGDAGYPDEGYQSVQNAPVITQDIIDNGAVMAYLSTDKTQWFALPMTFPTGLQDTVYDYSESWNYVYLLNTIVVEIQDSDFWTMAPQDALYLKVVAVAGTELKRKKDINWLNYEQVRETYNLE